MHSALGALTVTACTALICLGPGTQNSDAQQMNAVTGGYFPRQLVRGETTILHMALPRNNPPVQSVEMTPSAGITVTGMTSRDLGQGSTWWDFTITVAKDAAPGPRTFVAVRQTGRTAPVTLMIPDHVPNISNLRILSAQTNQPTIELQFAASDQGGTFGDAPYVWFSLACPPGKPESGVVYGKLENAAMRASIPNPRLAPHAGAPDEGNHCDLQLRTTDSSGIDSNTVSTAFDLK
jgi:hypothetical protein